MQTNDGNTALWRGTAALSQVRAYWQALRKDGHVPLRSDVDPRGMADALEWTFLAERLAPGAARFRIAGMGLADIVGVDITGMPLLSLLVPQDRARAADLVEMACSGPATVELHLEAERGPGRPPLTARLVLLPLRAADGRVSLLLGTLAVDGEIGMAPRRFAIARSAVVPLTVSPAHSTAPDHAMAESAEPFVQQAEDTPRLRLVHAVR